MKELLGHLDLALQQVELATPAQPHRSFELAEIEAKLSVANRAILAAMSLAQNKLQPTCQIPPGGVV